MIEHIPYPRHEEKLPVVLSPAEVAAVFAATRNLKHRTILMTLYATGLRVSELTHLRVSDIDSQRQVICVRQGKGRKDRRQVMLSPKLLELLRIYWKSYRPTVWLFPGKPAQRPITREAVFLICRQAGKAAHLSKRISPHTLRHYAEFRTMPSKFGRSLHCRLFPDIRLGIVWAGSSHGCWSNGNSIRLLF
jgi:integrase/recombinase XerD